MTTYPMMTDFSIEQLIEDIIIPAQRLRGNGETHGFGRLVESTVAMEKTLAELIKCQVLHTSTCQRWLSNQPTPFPAMQLVSWTEATNRWLEGMVMCHWIWFARLRKLLPYWSLSCHVRNDERKPSAILEAHLQTVSASASLAEAQIQLITQIVGELQHPPTNALRLYQLERGIIQILESMGESLRIMARKHEHIEMFENGKVSTSTLDPPVQEMRASLIRSINKLDVQTAGSPLASQFIPMLKDTLNRLMGSLDVSKNSAPLIFHPEPPLPKPWLNEKVFGHFSKGTK